MTFSTLECRQKRLRAGIPAAPVGRRCQMQDVVGEAADLMQAGRMVEVGDERHRPGVAPARRLQRITQQENTR